VTILPPETTAYTDTDVLDDTAYLYRLQALNEEGNDSDFTTALVEVQSLPAWPGAPTLIAVTTEAADALGLEWSAPATGVVSAYRVERSLSGGGPFTTTLETGSGITATTDKQGHGCQVFRAMCSRTHKQASLVAPSSWKVRFRSSLDLTAERWRELIPTLSANAFWVMPLARNSLINASKVTLLR
jgi:hypothetical protein